ncbi:MAG: hypothetical protein OEZ43_10715 [Gammaproteobacteria bacterium]|nr:hypothetical protein [Gammaproteobacteria bacterium]
MTEQSIEALESKRQELRERLEKIEQDYRSGLDADSEERALQLENAEVLEGIAKATAEELAKVEELLADLKS